MTTNKNIAVAQIDGILTQYEAARKTYGDGMPTEIKTELATRIQAAIDRLAPPGSAYLSAALQVFTTDVKGLVPILRALRADYDAGHMQSLHELIHGELFSSFIDMAEHLCAEGYKDAAGVIAGSVLEEHLRKMCAKATIVVVRPDSTPKKSSLLNDELKSSGAYGALDHKNVTAWLAIRNAAAHGHYGAYTKEQVTLLIPAVRDFIARHPA